MIADLVKERSRDELFEKGQAAGLPCAPVNDPGDFVRDEQPLARDLFASPHESGGDHVTIPWRWCPLEHDDAAARAGRPRHWASTTARCTSTSSASPTNSSPPG